MLAAQATDNVFLYPPFKQFLFDIGTTQLILQTKSPLLTTPCVAGKE